MKKSNIFFVGIKGVAMANLAIIFKKLGHDVTGSDLEEEFITDKILTQNKIHVINSFLPVTLPYDTDLLVYSAAHGGLTNNQVKEAIKRKIKVINQAELIENLSKTHNKSVAVCGCHGKTTTTALLSYTLLQLGVNPTYLVGAPNFRAGKIQYPGGDSLDSNYFIYEADEYAIDPPRDIRPKLNFYKPDYVLATNIGYDHPDVYRDLGHTKQVFLEFFQNRKIVIICGDDENIYSIKTKIKSKCLTYGFNNENNLVISKFQTNNQGSKITVNYLGKKLGVIKSALYGEKNISNLAGVVLFLINLGFSFEKIKKAVKNFSGVKRRLEHIYSKNNIHLFDDYAHHPQEISATINALRKRYSNHQLISIFQPHTYSRTKSLLNEFAASLLLSDKSIIAPIFPSAREKTENQNVSSQMIADIANKIRINTVYAVHNSQQIIKRLEQLIDKKTIIVILGAGDIYKLQDDIIRMIKKTKQKTLCIK